MWHKHSLRWFLIWALGHVPGHLCAIPCSELFKEFVRDIHRPAFEWSAHISGEGESFELAQKSGYEYLAKIARRQPPPLDPNKHKAAIETVDSFFNEVIKGYPEATQQSLRTIYNGTASHIYSPDLFVRTQNLANWHLREDANHQPQFSVELDEGFRNTKLIRKILLIHECAVHIGQVDQRLGQVGADQLMMEHQTNDPYLFTEMSAALAEKTLISSLDFSAIEADAGRISNPVLRLGVLGQLYITKKVKLKDYVELHHRRETFPPSAEQVQEFMRRPK